MVGTMSRKFKIPISEQFGKERGSYYPSKDSPQIDYFDPDEGEE
jgi:hypothetical protein